VRILGDPAFLARATAMGDYLVAELEKLKSRFPVILEVRGIGLMIGVNLAIPGAEIVKKGHDKGLLLNVTHDTVLRLVPPLVVSAGEIDEMITILADILQELPA
jgi:acetylornithine aminotransferase